MPGTLYVVATPIGNLEDITLRALRVLREVQLIAAEDTRHTAKLLAHFQIATRTLSLHEHNERQRIPHLISRLEAGDDVAVVSDAGTPGVSDPGYRLIGAALAKHLRVIPVPGASAVLAALVASGLPTDTFTFLGFPPRRSKDLAQWVAALAGQPHTVVFFEAPHRIRSTLRKMATVMSDRIVAVSRELTKVHEQLVKGPIMEIAEAPFEDRGEFTIVIAPERSRDSAPITPPSDGDIRAEFGRIAEHCESRRRAVVQIARNYGISARDVYTALERTK